MRESRAFSLFTARNPACIRVSFDMIAARSVCEHQARFAILHGHRSVHLDALSHGPQPRGAEVVYEWNTAISENVRRGEAQKAFGIYERMQQSGVKPDRITFISMFRACSNTVNAREMGNWMHQEIIIWSFDRDTSLGNALISLHAKHGALDDARSVFYQLPNYDIISWGAIIGAYAQCGCSCLAFLLFEKMEMEGFQANHVIFLSIIKACSTNGDINLGKMLHSRILSAASASNVALGNSLISMYCRCSNLEEAQRVFYMLPIKDVITYSALVGELVEQSRGHQALNLIWEMLGKGLRPNRYLYLCATKACAQVGDHVKGRYINKEIVQDELDSDVFVRSYLVCMYGKCCTLEDARATFDIFPVYDTVLWGVMIEEYVKREDILEALTLFEEMQKMEINPNKVVFLSLLRGCGHSHAVYEGKQIHDLIIKSELESDVMIGSSIIDMYCKCSHLTEACNIFNKFPNKNVICWTTIIIGHVLHGYAFQAVEFFSKMQKENVKPDSVIFSGILKACAVLQDSVLCNLVHMNILECNLEKEINIHSSLVDSYVKCGSLKEFMALFHTIRKPDVAHWGSVIAGHIEHGLTLQALELLDEMQHEKIQSNDALYLCILKACSGKETILAGRLIHVRINRDGFETNLVVGSALIDMYAKYGTMEDAQNVFDRLKDRNVVSWGALIAGYAQHGCIERSFDCLQQMHEQGIEVNKVIALGLLKACKGDSLERGGKFIHNLVQRRRLDSDMHIGSSLVDMYARCGMLEKASEIFSDMSHKDSTSYCTLISGYVQHGHARSAFELFEIMMDKGVYPSRITLSKILKTCSSIGAIKYGQIIHGNIIKLGLEDDSMIKNSLLDMCASCMGPEEDHQVLRSMCGRDVFLWSVLILAYARSGKPESVDKCLKTMHREQLTLDPIIFASIIAACAQAGQFQTGCKYFDSMRVRDNISPTINHYNSLIDLFNRVGRLNEATELLQTMPPLPDTISWRCMLSACSMTANIHLGSHCLGQFLNLDAKEQ